MRGDEAKSRCPEVVLCSVPSVRGKADLTRYRDAGAEVLRVLAQFGGALERASVDEAYLDLTGETQEEKFARKTRTCAECAKNNFPYRRLKNAVLERSRLK